MKLIQKILVPLDGSNESEKAAELAIYMAEKMGAELMVLSAISIPSLFSPLLNQPQNQTVINNLLAEEESYALSYIAPVVSKASNAGLKVESKVVKTGLSVVTAICDAAKSENVDLIVMGSRGRGGLRKVLLGSISSGVLTYAHCPVLITR